MSSSPIFVLGYAAVHAPHSLPQLCKLGRELEPIIEIQKKAQHEAKLAQEALAGKKEKTHLDLVHRLQTSKKSLTAQDILHYFCFMQVIGQPEPQTVFWIPATGNTWKDINAVRDITDALKTQTQLYAPQTAPPTPLTLAKKLMFGYRWPQNEAFVVCCRDFLQRELQEEYRDVLSKEIIVCEQSGKRVYARFLEENYVMPLLREKT